MQTRALIVFALLGSAEISQGDSTPPANQSSEDRADLLIAKAQLLPDVGLRDATVAAHAALLVETERVPAELLIAIAWGESRFVASTVTNRACGLLQVIAGSRAECSFLEIPLVNAYVARRQLEEWLRVSRGDLRKALLGNACGFSAFTGTCSKTRWPGWVLERARSLGWSPKRPASSS